MLIPLAIGKLCIRLIAKTTRISHAKIYFIAIDLQLYKIFKITRVSFLGHSVTDSLIQQI